jgi:hypothetical protein
VPSGGHGVVRRNYIYTNNVVYGPMVAVCFRFKIDHGKGIHMIEATRCHVACGPQSETSRPYFVCVVGRKQYYWP